MTLNKLLIANRGEVAIRIARAAEELGIATVSVFSEDDAASLHTRKSDEARALRQLGRRRVSRRRSSWSRSRVLLGCDAIHPGYGFLSESAEFARRCASADSASSVRPPEQLELFGDKLRARALAVELGIPVLRATPGRGGPRRSAGILARARARRS